jgi:hypothetical protein
MSVNVINPRNGLPLKKVGNHLMDEAGQQYPILNGVPRIFELDDYTENFGAQWSKFARTQLDPENYGLHISRRRFFAETHWNLENLTGKNILEVGPGAGSLSMILVK